MKIQVLGTSCTWFQRKNTSYIINDEMLVDVPQGSFKTIINNCDLANIKYIIITHFHSDHFADLHILASFIYKLKLNHKIIIYAPKHARKKLVQLCKCFEISNEIAYINKYFQFVTIKTNEEINIGEYKIKFKQVQHGTLNCYGFTIQQKSKSKIIGFTADSGLCKSVEEIIESADVVFMDTSNLTGNLKHMGLDNYFHFCKTYNHKEFYPVHMNDAVYEKLKNKIYDGKIFNF